MPMRGRLMLLIASLLVGGLVLSWKFANVPVASFGLGSASRDLLKVPPYAGSGLTLPSSVRVNLSSAPVNQIEIAVDGPYEFRSSQTSEPIASGPLLDRSTFAVDAAGFRLNGRRLASYDLELVSERDPAIWVGDHQYRGRIRFARQSAGRMFVINTVALEDYIASVVDGEMPGSFPEAARLAQAIVARTYALYQIRAVRDESRFDVYATTRSQNYLGSQYRNHQGRRLAAESEASLRAAGQTAGMVCLCEGDLFCTYYTAVCGGQTSSGQDVFSDDTKSLTPVRCEWCKDSDLYRWETRVPLSQATAIVRRHFASKGKNFGDLTSIRRTGNAKRVGARDFELDDGKRREKLSAIEIRRLFPSRVVPSYQFEVRVADGKVFFVGRGHGHGVGLCQWGARGMALEGAGPLAIIGHYYPAAEVVRLQ